MMLEDFQEHAMNINEITTTFIPTISILEKMREILLVQEQINAILMGVTYTKNHEFFHSDDFMILIEKVLDSEKEGNILEDAYEEEDDADEKEDEWNKRQRTVVDNQIVPSKKQAWANKIIDFLTQSNEKWILDQFNLCKRFLLQNSIEGYYEDFSHPFYNKFNHIKSMKVKNSKKLDPEDAARGIFETRIQGSSKKIGRESSKAPEVFDISRDQLETPIMLKNRPRNGSVKSGLGRVSDVLPPQNYLNMLDQKLMKCDIAALLKAIEEIEKRLRMEKILTKSEKEREGLTMTGEMDEASVKALRNQFSMLNFNRNYKAVKDALETPSEPNGTN